MNTNRMREVVNRRKKAEANKAAGEGTSAPRPPPPPPPPKKVQPVTVVPPSKPTEKRLRSDSDQGSADHHRPSSPSSRIIPGTDGFRVESSRSLRVAVNSAMSLLRSTKVFSDALSKKEKDFSDLEAEHDKVREVLRETQVARRKAETEKKELEEALTKKDEDLKGAVASRELVGQQLNKVSKEYSQYRADMDVKVEDLEYQQATAYIRGYETAIEHVKFKTPNYDFTDLRWDIELKDGRLVTAEEMSMVHMIEEAVVGETPGGQEVQQEMPQSKRRGGAEQP